MYNYKVCYLKAKEICEEIRQGKDVAKEIAKIEPWLKNYYKECRETWQKEYYFLLDEVVHSWDALYDVSKVVKEHWDTIYPNFAKPESRYQAVIRFANAREKFLGIPHTESIDVLKEIGWTSIDIMAAYVNNHYLNSTFLLSFSPDAVAKAAREDMDAAVRLMEKEGHDSLFTYGYTMHMQFGWIDFMYLFMKYEDCTFLTTQHKSKRLCKHCTEVLEKLEQGAAKHEEVEVWTDLLDFSVFEGVILTQRHLLASAAGQRLRKGNDWSSYVKSYHLVDEQHGYGAALCFAPLLKAPEYYDKETTVREVCFYRFDYFMPFDYVPESWRCSPTELPEEFVKKVYRSFCKLAGLEKRK